MSQSLEPMVRVTRDPNAESQRRPLSFSLVMRLWGLMKPYAAKRNLLVGLVLLRAMQLPALAWSIGAVINGPITRGESLHAIVTRRWECSPWPPGHSGRSCIDNVWRWNWAKRSFTTCDRRSTRICSRCR